MHKSVCFHEFLWTCEKPVTDESGIYCSAEQPCVMEPGGSVTISSPWRKCRVAKQHPGMHPSLGT